MHPLLLYYWYRTPMLRPVLALSAGIICQWYAPLSLLFIGVVAALALTLVLIVFWGPDKLRRRTSLPSLLCSALLFFSLGSILCIKTDVRNHPQWIGHAFQAGRNHTWKYIVCEDPTEKPRSYALLVRVQTDQQNIAPESLTGKVLLYLPKDDRAARLQPGDTIWAAKLPTLIEPPKNPGERNWQQAQLMKGITHRLYLQADEYRSARCKKFSVQKNLSLLRKRLLSILRQNISDPTALGMAQALLIGYRQDLDPTLSRSYSNTGVIHIIAISGMHLALIGGLLNWCLHPFTRWRPIKRLAQLLVLAGLWLFSLLAGGAPSLLRATLLFSSVAMGEIIDRKGNSLNTLMVSALLLLCYDPFWLWDLGFQLSFAAVGGILLIGRYTSRLLSHNKIWWHAPGQLVAISIAAQLFTTPISLYQFHQFPGAFLLGNLVAVPLSSIILAALLLLLICCPVPMVAIPLGSGIAFLIEIMNRYIQWVESLPGLLITDLHWSLPATLLLFATILLASHWIINRSRSACNLTLLLSCLLLGWQGWHRYQQKNQRLLVVYHLSGTTAIDLVTGTLCQSWTDSGAKNNYIDIGSNLRAARRTWGIQKTLSLPKGQQLNLGIKKILLPDKHRVPPNRDTTRIDLLVIGRNAPYRGEEWVCGKRIGTAVLDGSVGARTRERWIALLDSMAIPIHDTKINGAFVSSFR